MSIHVMFKGEVYAVTGLSMFEMLSKEYGHQIPTLLFKLQAVEAAQPFKHRKCALVPRDTFVWLPSGIDFEQSEWYQGVNNGQSE